MTNILKLLKFTGPVIGLFTPAFLFYVSEREVGVLYALTLALAMILNPISKLGMQIEIFGGANNSKDKSNNSFHRNIVLTLAVSSLLCLFYKPLIVFLGCVVALISSYIYKLSIKKLLSRNYFVYAFYDQGIVFFLFAITLISFNALEIKLLAVEDSVYKNLIITMTLFYILIFFKNRKSNNIIYQVKGMWWLFATNMISTMAINLPFLIAGYDMNSSIAVDSLKIFERGLSIITSASTIVAPFYYEQLKSSMGDNKKKLRAYYGYSLLICMPSIYFYVYYIESQFAYFQDSTILFLTFVLIFVFPLAALVGFRLNIEGKANGVTVTTLLSLLFSLAYCFLNIKDVNVFAHYLLILLLTQSIFVLIYEWNLRRGR